MVYLVSYSVRKAENDSIITSIRDTAAVMGGQSWECIAYLDSHQAAERLKTGQVDLISWDVAREESRAAISSVRGSCDEAFLLVVADQDTSPLQFLTPSIHPNSLLLRPLTQAELQRTASEMVNAVRHRWEADSGDALLITRRNEQRWIPYRSICYFEARGKKLYARLRTEEIGFSGTLDQLETSLPTVFKRCHRSFIVNTARIERVLLSQNLICLWDGLTVPLSRSFKKVIKEASHESI